jgi:hypothetical protein
VHFHAVNNPSVDPAGTAFRARASCRNNSGGAVWTVTCQITKP